jgi:ribosomal protein S12 methylthiotransferase accessory factor
LSIDDVVSPLGPVSRTYELHSRQARAIGLFGCAGSAGTGNPGPSIDSVQSTGAVFASDDSEYDRGLARRIAVAEALERLAGGVPSGSRILRGAWENPALGRRVALGDVPACSLSERENSAGRIIEPGPADEIRWMSGWDLHTGTPALVPLVMAAYRLQRWPTEEFWYGISTGHAVHATAEQAILSGLLECIERDAIMVSWLQKISLPRLDAGDLGEGLTHVLSTIGDGHVDVTLLDATFDLGVPCVFALLRAAYDDEVTTTVGAGCHPEAGRAAQKAVKEAFLQRRYMHRERGSALEPALPHFTDGARFMARSINASAFDFWTAKGPSSTPSVLSCDPTPDGQLRAVLGRLADQGMEAFVVSKSTSELRVAGLTGVCCVVPALQPMTLVPWLQYRGHRRLYELPRRLGLDARPEAQLNRDALPFA